MINLLELYKNKTDYEVITLKGNQRGLIKIKQSFCLKIKLVSGIRLKKRKISYHTNNKESYIGSSTILKHTSQIFNQRKINIIVLYIYSVYSLY